MSYIDDSKPNLKCVVCSGHDFDLVDGFYYCGECGTQSQTVRQMEADNLHEARQSSKHKIKKPKPETKKEMTTFEGYNLILKGLTDELIEAGAPIAVRLTVLQLWTDYLSRTKVAFFNQEEMELPKLPLNFKTIDAKLLYNQERPRSKASASTKSRTSEKAYVSRTAQASRRNKASRSLMQSEYESLMASREVDVSKELADVSIKTVNSTFDESESIPLRFNTPSQLITYTCKATTAPSNEFGSAPLRMKDTPRLHYKLQMRRELMFVILYCALNHCKADIQLSDLIRWIREGHLSYHYIDHFFPDDVGDILRVMRFSYLFPKKFVPQHNEIRQAVSSFTTLVPFEPRRPDILQLARRYVRELCLPEDLAVFIERMIVLCEPEMKKGTVKTPLPCYEGRAVAYILYVLKLIYGLDNVREKTMSESAKRLNAEMAAMGVQHPPLFVFTEWMEFVEMRGILIGQYHYSTSIQRDPDFKDCTHLYLECLERIRNKADEEEERGEKKIGKGERKARFAAEFAAICTELGRQIDGKGDLSLSFPPTLMPSTDYLRQIREKYSNQIEIPAMLDVDHSKRSLEAFIKRRHLKAALHEVGVTLRCEKVVTNPNMRYVDIISDDFKDKLDHKNFINRYVDVISTDEDEDTWLETIAQRREQRDRKKTEKLFQKSDYLQANAEAIREKEEWKRRHLLAIAREGHDQDNLRRRFDPGTYVSQLITKRRETLKPRPIEEPGIFDDMSDASDDEATPPPAPDAKTVTLSTPNYDYWLRFVSTRINNEEFELVAKEFPRSFRWLLDECSRLTELSPREVYMELMTVENYFTYVLQPMNRVKNQLLFQDTKQFNEELCGVVKFLKRKW